MGREVRWGLVILTLLIIIVGISIYKKSVYKKGQGSLARWVSFFCLQAMVFFGCVTIYSIPTLEHPLSKPYLVETAILSQPLNIKPMILICLPVFFSLAIAVFWFVNRPKSSDFLIETEGELKKVSWPQRKEWINSTIAVLVVIVFTTVFLTLISSLVVYLMRQLKIGV